MDIDKDKIIRDVYYTPSGYGSMRQTLDDARKKDKTIKMEDVKQWFNRHVVPSREPRGYNSWIADHPRQEYQSDLFFFGTQEFRYPGSTALLNGTVGGITRLTQNGGGLFDLNSIQLTSLVGNDSVTVNFTGTKADSSTVSQAFTTDAILSTLETFTFNSSFTNLVSVQWIQAFPFHQFDNINVTPVPEPSAILGLLGLGLLGIGSQFKQKR